MVSDVVLGGALRSTLLSNIQTQRSLDTTTLRLATGLKVNSALDNPQNFFAAQSLTNRASDLQRLLDGLGQNIQTIKEADIGITALGRFIEQAEAVAQEAVELNRSAPTQARVVGNTNLRETTDLTDQAGIANGDRILLSFKDPDDLTYFPAQSTITINNGDNADQIVAEINALNAGLAEPVVKASITSNGALDLKTLDESILSVEFIAAVNTTANNLNLANALGFGDEARAYGDGLGVTEVQFSVVPGREVQSFQLFNAASDEVAQRSDRISQLEGANNTLLFLGLDNVADEFDIGYNGGNTQTVTLDTNQTIQGLIDTVNNSGLSDALEADFDEDEGRITIRATDDSVESIETALRSNGVAISFFGFNHDIPVTLGAQDDQDTIRLGTIAGPSANTIAQLESDYNNILDQIDNVTQDAQYRGINLLEGENLVSYFDEERSNSLTTEGRDFTALGLGLETADFTSLAQATTSVSDSREALLSVRSYGQSIANDLAIIETRTRFTEVTINTLKSGGDDLTVADQNEEGANLLAAQTRQALGVTALSFLGQQQGTILTLFG